MGEWYEDLSIGSKTIKFQLDTGAEVKVIQNLDIECHFKKSQAKPKSYSGHQIPSKGVVTLPCEYNSKVFHVKFHVVDVAAPAVLCSQTYKDMGLLARLTSATQHSKVSN